MNQNAHAAAPFVCVYASQVAACIGANRHQKVSDAVKKMWQRISPEGFQSALDRNGLKTEDAAIRDLAVANVAVRSLVQRSLLPPDSSCEAASTYAGVHGELSGLASLMDDEKQLVDSALKRNVFTSYGTRAEPEALNYIREVLGVPCHADPTFYKQKMGEIDTGVGTLPWFLGGKVDAVSDDGTLVIEIKNRVHRLFRKAPLYEEIQIQSYLELLDIQDGVLVECLKPVQGLQTSVISVARNRVWWEYEIVPKLHAFVTFVVRLLDDTQLQDSFLMSKRPSAMVC